MDHSPTRQAALQDMPYRPMRREGTPRVCDMLADLTWLGSRMPPSPGSTSSPVSEEAATASTVRTPTDWTGPILEPSPQPTICIDPTIIHTTPKDSHHQIGGGSPYRKDLGHLTPIPSPTQRSMDQQQPLVQTDQGNTWRPSTTTNFPLPLKEIAHQLYRDPPTEMFAKTMLPTWEVRWGTSRHLLDHSPPISPRTRVDWTLIRKTPSIPEGGIERKSGSRAGHPEEETLNDEGSTMDLGLDNWGLAEEESSKEEDYKDPEETMEIRRINEDDDSMTIEEPGFFLGKEEDAMRWLMAMKVYFKINKEVYPNWGIITIIFLAKMNQGRAATFAKGWYLKLENSTISKLEKTLNKLCMAFKETFIPWHLTDWNQHNLFSLTM